MTKRDDLIRRLCEASEGSAELSAEVWTALTGVEHYATEHWGHEWAVIYADPDMNRRLKARPCLTTSLSAAWEEAERRGYNEIALTLCRGRYYSDVGNDDIARVSGECRTHALALCAAILAAEGER